MVGETDAISYGSACFCFCVEGEHTASCVCEHFQLSIWRNVELVCKCVRGKETNLESLFQVWVADVVEASVGLHFQLGDRLGGDVVAVVLDDGSDQIARHAKEHGETRRLWFRVQEKATSIAKRDWG